MKIVKYNWIIKSVGKIIKRFFLASGVFFILLIVLSFTDYPYLMYHWLGTSECKPVKSADYIVVMGAGGLPGPESLLRCYYAASVADSFPDSRLIIAFPVEKDAFEGSENELMVKELIERGILPGRILTETNGTNTYAQAKEIAGLVHDADASLLIVSSPEHIYRCIKTFRNQGFTDVNGLPTFENPTNDEIFSSPSDKNNILKNAERNVSLRYNMWSYLQYEIMVLREATAIVYYKLKGYI
jgi:uncharacterized SAM-binding protein YcdF (DUF218 family)